MMQGNAWQGRILWLVLIASLAFNAGVGSTFGVRAYHRFVEPARFGRPGGPPHGPRLLHALNLTEEQQVFLRNERGKLRERHHEVFQKIQMETDVLGDLLTSSEPDPGAIQSQLQKLAEFRQRLESDLVEHLLEVRRMLQPAQHEAFDEVICHTLHRGGKRHHGFRGAYGVHGGRGHPGRGRWQQDANDPVNPIEPIEKETDK